MPKKARAPFIPLAHLLAARYPDLDVDAALKSGRVLVDGRVLDNPASRVRADAAVRLLRERRLRGEIKLDHALPHFDVPVAGRVALDVGASAGGFTTALLAAGAARVYAVDVGAGQLVGRLLSDPRVVNLEGRNLATLTAVLVPEPVDVVVMDLSYLAVARAVPQLEGLRIAADAHLVALVKPTFELGRPVLARSPEDVAEAVRLATEGVEGSGWTVIGTTPSPPTPRGAVEVFLHARRRAPHSVQTLLRSPPPRRALDWAARQIGPATHVVRARPLTGGTSSAVHRLTVVDLAGPRRDVVLRYHVRSEVLADEPDIAAREAAVLRLLAGTAVPAPECIAVDPTGTEAGSPAVLMTYLRGRPRWKPTADQLEPYLREFALLLPVIHGVRPTPRVPPYRPYELSRELAPPPWTRHPQAWERAIAAYEGPPPSTEARFLHRDFHPGNVLWLGPRVSGVVDWASASVGPPEVDVGHCRANLVGHLGPAAADRFLHAWQAITGRNVYHPYWDIVVVVRARGSYGPPDPRIDDWVARAVAELR